MEKYSLLRSAEDRIAVESDGIILCMSQKGRNVPPNTDMMYPYIILSLNLSGTSHCLYDMKDITSQKNDLTVFMPGHIIRPLEHSEDYLHAWLLFDASKFADSELKISSTDFETMYQAPLCHLTDEQAGILHSILGVLDYIVSHTEEELPNKQRLLESQLSVAYELYMSIRREHDKAWNKNRMGHIYLQFCDMVVAHYKEERNANYYAEQLGYDSRYFAKIFRAFNNGTTPLAWIQNYIITQAKRIMNDHPKQSIRETAFQLGFPATANFCRYFKHVTGITPGEYIKKSASE